MKKTILAILFCLLSVGAAEAQSKVKYGYLSYDSLFKAMPEYAEAQSQMDELRLKYEAEVSYNEQGFKRLFAEFLQGQKDFPQGILLKRQRDLQDAMEKSLAFRHEADSLLAEAEKEMFLPVRERLNQVIRAVGLEHGYEYILNTDANAFPFIHKEVGEDAMPFALEKLGVARNE